METVLIPPEPPRAKATTMTTSLYEILEVLQDTAGADGDALVVATVMHLLESGRLTFPHRAGTHQCN